MPAHRLVVHTILALCLTGLAACQSPEAGTREADPPDPQTLVEAALADAPLFSGIAVISRHGRIAGIAVQGVADRETGRTVTPDTLFSIASAGKMLTAQAVDGLVQEGRLGFDTPVADLLPELADAVPAQLTVDHLLQHRSGFRIARTPDDAALDAVTGNHDMFALYMTLGLSSEGPADFRYDNANFVLLGEIVARVSGQPYERAVQRAVLADQGLETPVFQRPAAGDDRSVAHPYMPVDFQTWWNSETTIRGDSAADYVHPAPTPAPTAGGGALASGPDMARFVAAFAAGPVGERLCGIVAATEARGYGRGCAVRAGPYGRRYGHTGSTAGVQARVFAYPDRGYEIVILSNHDGEAAPVFNALEARLFAPATPVDGAGE